MKMLFAVVLFALAVDAAQKPKKPLAPPVLPVRLARVAFSLTKPPPPPPAIRRIDSAGWESSLISTQTLAATRSYPYLIVQGQLKWNTGTNSRFRIITRDLDGSWWDGYWTATFQNWQNVSIPVPTNATWVLVSP